MQSSAGDGRGRGAHFARMEIGSLLREVVTRMDHLAVAGPVERLHSTFIAGPRALPVTFRPSLA